MQYRRDVDGLRAIAVLSVILFHIDKALLPGGFVGVDVFFVISGYLITGNIAREIEKGRFSIVEFYRRRVKRIAPVMLLVIAVTLLAAHVLMLPEDSRSTAKSAIWSLLSMANVYFWLYQDTGYFAPDSAEIPLLHLWSLGVEEQFYILWPLLLLVLYRPGLRLAFMSTAALAALASFFLAAQLFDRAPLFAYYMLPTRAAELLLGAIAAIAILNGLERRVSSWMAGAMAAFGLALLIASLFFLNEHLPFPGWFAVPPTLGAALLILSGQCGEKWVTRLLSLGPLVWVGLISYSAYLWHWPLLALFRYGYGQLTMPVSAVMFVLILLLAWGSYRFVEQPARRSVAPAWHVFARYYVAPAGAVFIVCLAAIYLERIGIAIASEGYRQQLERMRSETQPAYLSESICQRQRILLKDIVDARCVLGAQSTHPPEAILWGDSNAAHYVGMINAFAREAGFRFRNVEIGSCPPIFSDPGAFVEARRDADCRASLGVVKPLLQDFRVVIVSASWPDYEERSVGFLREFYATARELARENKTVIIVGKAAVIQGYDRRCREKALSYPFLHCPNTEAEIPRRVLAVNRELRQFAESNANIKYFDANAFLCPNGRCSAYGTNGEPKYVDEGHLTLATTSKLGAEIIARDGVPTMFAEIGRLPAAKKQAGS